MGDACVARVPVFAGLPAEDQLRIERLARPTRLSPGEPAYPAGAAPPRLVVVHTGHLKVSRPSADGSERLLRVLGPGDFIGETAVFTGRPSEDQVVATDDCRLCVFAHEDVTALLARHPGIALRMLATVSGRLTDMENRLNALTSHDVESRLAGYLLGLPASWHEGVATVTLPVAKKDVAALLDTTPESLSRSLRSLSARGVVTVGPGRSVSVLRPDLLEQASRPA